MLVTARPMPFTSTRAGALFCTISFGLLGFTLFLSLYGLSLQGLAMGYAFLVVGHFAPRWYLAQKVKRRRREIFRELPDALDILLICIHAGLSFDRALIRVSGELKHIAPALSTEFEIYFYEVESGIPREQALAKLAQRNEEDSLTAVVNVLAQSVRFGTDIAEALRVYTESLRVERRQIAEEKRRKASRKTSFSHRALHHARTDAYCYGTGGNTPFGQLERSVVNGRFPLPK